MYKKQITTTKAKKGDVILHFNKPCKTIWHLVTGAARKIEMIEGSTKTTHFYTAPKVFTVLQSALKSIPSDLSIVCDEDCIFLELPFVELQKLYEKSRYIERIGRRIVEEEYIAEFSIRRMFLKMDALERYEYIEKTHPEVLKRFQLKDVATFLGITPETLSRLRKTRFA
ncbi:MAG: cyclic nucleotide-binding domain-containing protein [Bacteroidota bacterium]